MATPAELLDNMVPVSAFSRGKAAQAFSSASNSTRLTANQDAGSVPAEEVYAELGIALEDVDAIEDVELA